MRNPLIPRMVLSLAALAVSCDNGGGGPTTLAPPPKVLPQAPTSCTYRMDTAYYDDRVGRFSYDVRWFPPEQSGSDPVTTYEVEIIRAGVKGTSDASGFYHVTSQRHLPVANVTVRAKTATTDDLHTYNDAVTFPVCEMLARGEDLGFWANVRARSAAGLSLPFDCVDADDLVPGIIWLIGSDRGQYWSSRCNQTGHAPVKGNREQLTRIAVH